MSTFLRPPFSLFLQRLSCFVLGLRVFNINIFSILFNSCIIEFGIIFTDGRCTIFEIARVLKTVILPAIQRYLIFQIRIIFWSL